MLLAYVANVTRNLFIDSRGIPTEHARDRLSRLARSVRGDLGAPPEPGAPKQDVCEMLRLLPLRDMAQYPQSDIRALGYQGQRVRVLGKRGRRMGHTGRRATRANRPGHLTCKLSRGRAVKHDRRPRDGVCIRHALVAEVVEQAEGHPAAFLTLGIVRDRTRAGPGETYIIAAQAERRKHVIDLVKQVLNVLLGRLHVVDVALVDRLGGPDVVQVASRQAEEMLALPI